MEPKTAEKTTAGRTAGTPGSPPGTLEAPAADQNDPLRSWKDIAAFLACDERTARRWEERGMPVRRIPGAKRSRVLASRAEITSWLKEQRQGSSPPIVAPQRRTFTKRLVATAVVAGVLVLSIGVLILKLRPRKHADLPADARLSGQSLIVLDGDGNRLWTHAFGRKLNPVTDLPPARFALVADLLRNGGREVIAVVPYALGPNDRDGTEFEIDCFSDRGARLWSYAPRETFRFGVHDLNGPWRVRDLIVSGQEARNSIYVALVHEIWGNSFVAEIDPTTGRSTVRYVNTGAIHSLGELRMAGATYLVAAGFNNEYEGGSAALIDERRPFAASPQTQGTRHKCVSCPDGAPDYYLVFPQSEGNRALKDYENPVESVSVIGDEVQFGKNESGESLIEDGLYLFGLQPRIRPISLRYSSSYDLQHRELERAGALSHSLEKCPERLHPRPVRMWMPGAGWTELQFGPSGFDQ